MGEACGGENAFRVRSLLFGTPAFCCRPAFRARFAIIEVPLSKGLVIVESPTKAKTIQKYLGAGYEVEASFGHIKDLPKKSLGVDLDNDFSTEYVVIPGKEKVVAKLKKLAKSADTIYLAPDPDREGEAIAAHLAEELGGERVDGKKKKKAPVKIRRRVQIGRAHV